MVDEHSTRASGMSRLAAKAAYARGARKKLVESRAKLRSIRIAIRQATTSGRLRSNDRLDRAFEAMAQNLASAEVVLERLQKADVGEFERLRSELDTVWEDLSRTIKVLVDRFDDATSDQQASR